MRTALTTDGTQRVARTDSLAYSLAAKARRERAVGVVYMSSSVGVSIVSWI